MTERFEIFPQNVAKDGTLIIIQKGLKLYNISEVVDLLNELVKENKELRSDRDYWKTLAQSLARTNGNVKLKDEHLAWKRVDVE